MRYLDRFIMSVGFALMLCGSASAYLDPSVMTYTIQVVAGVVVAVGAVVVFTGVRQSAKWKISWALTRIAKKKWKLT